jgi:hypothetical protein
MITQEPESFRAVVRAIFAERFGEAGSAIGHTVHAQLLDAIRSDFPGLTD